jgi:hypothetical protein
MDRFLQPVVVSQRPPLILRAGVAVVTLAVALGLSLLFRFFFGTGTFLLSFGAVAIIATHYPCECIRFARSDYLFLLLTV